MPKYEIEVKETLYGTYIVEADSADYCEEAFEALVKDGSIDFSNMEVWGREIEVIKEVKEKANEENRVE